MREKNKIILLTHGRWGNALIKSMGMLIGKTENIFDIPLEPNFTLEQYVEMVEKKSEPVDSNTLVLTDIPGGTTSNVALKLTQKYEWRVISGVNALMLIEAIMDQNKALSDEVIRNILDAGKNSQKELKISIKK